MGQENTHNECAGRVPGLNLLAKEKLHFPRVLGGHGREDRGIQRVEHFGAKGADIVKIFGGNLMSAIRVPAHAIEAHQLGRSWSRAGKIRAEAYTIQWCGQSWDLCRR